MCPSVFLSSPPWEARYVLGAGSTAPWFKLDPFLLAMPVNPSVVCPCRFCLCTSTSPWCVYGSQGLAACSSMPPYAHHGFSWTCGSRKQNASVVPGAPLARAKARLLPGLCVCTVMTPILLVSLRQCRISWSHRALARGSRENRHIHNSKQY